MSSNTALAALPAALASLTVRAGMRYFTARLVTNGINSASVSSLLEGAIKAMFLTKLKFAVVASGLIATGAVVVAQQSVNISESISRPARSAVTESYSATPAAPSDTATDDVTVARELRRLDIDLLAEEVEQLRTRVELTLRDKLRAERQTAGTASEGQGTQPKNVQEPETACKSARTAYLAKSRELRNAQRSLEETTESRLASPGKSRGLLTSGDGRAEDRPTNKLESHPAAAAIGSIEIAAVIERYEKAQRFAKQFNAFVSAEKVRQNKLMDQVKDLIAQKAKTAPSSSDFTFLENQIIALKQQHESLREVLEREYSQRQTRNAAALLEDIEQAIAAVARAKGLNYVIKVLPGLKPDSEPNDVMTALNRSVLYADPRNDITEEVIRTLNQKYRAIGAKTSKSR